jgi:hypothetical protein
MELIGFIGKSSRARAARIIIVAEAGASLAERVSRLALLVCYFIIEYISINRLDISCNRYFYAQYIRTYS